MPAVTMGQELAEIVVGGVACRNKALHGKGKSYPVNSEST